MRAVVAVVVVALAACGRIGFDASSDGAVGPGDAATDAGAPFVIELPRESAVTAIAKLPDGGVALAGARIGILTLDGITDPGVGAVDVVVAAFDPDGRARWLHQYGGTENDYPQALAVAPDGTIYVGGYAEGTSQFGGPTRANLGRDAFLASYTATGAFRWSLGFGGDEAMTDYNDEILGLAVAPDGDVIAVGRVAGDVDFGAGTTLPLGPVNDAFVARFSPTGALRWARRFGGEGMNALVGVDVATDAIYVAGYYEGTPDFGAGALPARGANDAVTARLSPDGTTTAWTETFGGTNNQRIYGLALADATVVVAGYYWDAVDLPAIMPSRGKADAIVVGYAATTGALAWAASFGDTGCDVLRSAHASGADTAVAGSFASTIDLGIGPVTAQGLTDSLVVGFDASAPEYIHSLGDATDELAADSAGTPGSGLYLGGTRNTRNDQGCYPIVGETTGYLTRL